MRNIFSFALDIDLKNLRNQGSCLDCEVRGWTRAVQIVIKQADQVG